MSAFPLKREVRFFLACLALMLVGCEHRLEAAGSGIVQETLRVLVHEGGPRFTASQPELLSVALLKSDGAVMTGQLLDSPQVLRVVAVGDTIKFVRVPGYPHPIFVTDRYLIERRHSYVFGCEKCGFSELFDCPSDLASATFPGQRVPTFTARCPICGGSQLVRLLPATPSTPRDASATQIATAVQSVVMAQFDTKGSIIAFDQRLSELGADELDLVENVFALEEHFVVNISDKRLKDLSTITLKDLVTAVTFTLAERQDDQPLRAAD